jgi:hypothetical protein
MVIGRVAKTTFVAEEEIALKPELAALVAVTEHVTALVTVRESVLVMLHPLVDVA